MRIVCTIPIGTYNILVLYNIKFVCNFYVYLFVLTWMNVVLTESIGPRVIYRWRSFQNECISTIVVTPIPTKPGTYGLQFVRDVRQEDNTIL